MTTLNTCFQCGKKTVVVKTYKEVVSGSTVTTTESICSDPECQKRTESMIRKENAKRAEAMYSKSRYGKKPISDNSDRSDKKEDKSKK